MIDVIIIGSGPSGLSAAIACLQAKLKVTILDEFMKPGGRLLGQLHQEPNGEWWNGIEETKKLVDRVSQLGADLRCGISVYHVEKLDEGFRVHTNEAVLDAKQLLIATGAAETAAPIPGWTLPGVMSIGAAQVMTNVHRVRVGNKGIVAGVNVLSAAIARELQLAGVELHSMMLPAKNAVTKEAGNPRHVIQAMMRVAHLAPSPILRLGSKFANAEWVRNLALTFFPSGGIKMWGMPIHMRKAITQINGTKQVESVTVVKVTADGEPIAGTEETIAVDFVCIAGGLYPLAELAAIMGCPFLYIEELGGHVPVHNERMETPIDGLFVAGNITGIESAKVARAQGTVAGLSIALRATADRSLEASLQQAMADVHTTRKNASIQFHPGIAAGRARVAQAFEQHAAKRTAQ